MNDLGELRLKSILALTKGDFPGHPFRGNQHTAGKGGGGVRRGGGKKKAGGVAGGSDNEKLAESIRIEAETWKDRLREKGGSKADLRAIDRDAKQAVKEVMSSGKQGSKPSKKAKEIQSGASVSLSQADMKKLSDDDIIRQVRNTAKERTRMTWGSSDQYNKRKMNSYDLRIKQAEAEASKRGMKIPKDAYGDNMPKRPDL